MANSDHFKKGAGDAAHQAKEAAHQAKAKAGQLAHDNRDKIAGAIGRLTSVIDKKTSGKYHDKLAKAEEAALKGADKLAEQRPDHSDEGGTPGDVPPADPEGGPNPPTGV